MTPEALAVLQLLGDYGGVVTTDAGFWSDMAAGISTSLSEGWMVSSDGAYRLTPSGEAALYGGLTS